MQFVKTHTYYTYEEKKSKFIAHLFPFNQFDTIMEQLKLEHPKARHFVYAYRYLNEFDQIVENSSDDGEPKNTSGKPSLAVLAGKNLINTGVIIVRYFGGVKLGTGGLVKAYSDSVNLAIANAQLFPYIKLCIRILCVEYGDLSKIEYQIIQCDISIKEKDFKEDVRLTLEASQEEFDKLSQMLPLKYQLQKQ